MTACDPTYAMGRSEAETGRLMVQSNVWDGNTKRLLEEAGVTTGMTTLGIGCGAGDVSFVAAQLVGPTGIVVGIDQNPEVLITARERAQAAGYANVTFGEGDFRSAECMSASRQWAAPPDGPGYRIRS